MCKIICSSFTFIALHVHVYLKSTLYRILVFHTFKINITTWVLLRDIFTGTWIIFSWLVHLHLVAYLQWFLPMLIIVTVYFLTCIPCAEDFSAATKWDVLLGDTSPRSTWRHWSLLGTGETVQLDCRMWAVLGSKSGRVSDCFNSSFLHSLACSTLKKMSKDSTTSLQRPNI